MLKTGDFSKLSRVSIRMLRHYDEIGLLSPMKWIRKRDIGITERVSCPLWQCRGTKDSKGKISRHGTCEI